MLKKKHKIIIASSILFATGGIGAIATGFAMQLNPKQETKNKEIITKKYVDKVEEIKITKPVEKIKYVDEPQKYSNQNYVDRNEIMEMLSSLNDNNLNNEFNSIKNNESELLKFKDKIKPLYLNNQVRNEINVYSLNSGLITPELNEIETKLNAEPENSDYLNQKLNILKQQKWVRVLESIIREMQTFITNNPNHNAINQLENATTLMRLWVENKDVINVNLKPYFIYDTYHHTNNKLKDWLNKHQLNINQPQILFLGSSYLNLNSKSSFYNKDVSLYLNIINKLNDVNIKNDFQTTFNLNYDTLQNNHEIYYKIINQRINLEDYKKVIHTLFDFTNKDKSNPKLISINNNEVERNYELVYVNKIDNYDNILNFVVDANIFNDELIKNQHLENLKLLKEFSSVEKQEIINKINEVNTFYLQKQKEKLLKLLENDWNELLYQQSLELLMFDKFNYLMDCVDGSINTDEINDVINKIELIKQKNNVDLNNQIDMIWNYLMTHPYKTIQQFNNFKVFVNENIS